MTRTARPPWLGIEVRHLAALAAVAREGSFRGAADRLGYVQSAISQQLAHLEELVGTRLVERRRGMSPIALTEAGALLLHHVDEILARFSAAQADMEALATGRAGQLRVGVGESVGHRFVPHVLVGFARRMPGIDVYLEEGGTDELATAIEVGSLDVCFGDLPLPSGPFEWRELQRDPYVLLAPRMWPVAASRQPPTLAELADTPLIRVLGCPEPDAIDAELQARGLEPKYSIRSHGPSVVQVLVGAGLGAAIVPRMSVDAEDARTTLVDLGELVPPRVMTLFWHRERQSTSSLETFVEAAAAACQDTSPLHVDVDVDERLVGIHER